MGLGFVFMVAAAVLFFLGGIGVTAIPNPMIWGLFCIAMSFVLGGYSIALPRFQRR